MKKLLAAFVCAFIPSSKIRKQTRKKIQSLNLHDLLRKKIKYDLIFSLGEACFVPDCLKINNLRKYSGPFDWMYGSTFQKRMEIFINRFYGYFDKADLKYDKLNPDNSKAIYINQRTGLVYNHDFDPDVPFDIEYKNINEKYQRRIKRIFDILKNGGQVLVVYAEMRGPDDKKFSSVKEVIELIDKANKEYGNKLDFVYFKNNKNMKPGTARQIYKNKYLIIFEYLGSRGGDIENVEEEMAIRKNISDSLKFAGLK
ncbi:MAG: papain-like cysteine peptidase [Alphaproteobacteria bacterium]|nr:papain-like cysteine peptidase [Alphaproteobacteria bacterium]